MHGLRAATLVRTLSRTACVAVLLLPCACSALAENPPAKEVVYKQTPQGELKMHFDFPADWKPADKRTAIVFFFGGGWSGGKVDQFADQAAYFAKRGMVAARADYRVKTRHDVSPDKCVEDAQSAVRYLRKNAAALGIDPDRIVAAGGSAGGHLAACTGTLAPRDTSGDDGSISSRANALVLFNPVLQFTGSESLMSRIAGDEALGRALSPTLHVKKNSPPAIMFFGDADKLFAQSEGYLAKAREVGARAELSTAPGQPHGYFNRSPWKEHTLYRADEFLASLGYVEGRPTVEPPPLADVAKNIKGHEQSLFDGQTLAGWTAENGCEVAVDDGNILLKEGNGWVRSDHVYADFLLHVEWKAVKEADYDSGVYIRTARQGTPFPKPSYQCNLLTGMEGNIGSLKGAVSTGLVKAGEWNTFDIAVIGDTVEMTINGKKAYRIGGVAERTGYIGLQCEVPKGGQFRFRNIRVTELSHKGLVDEKLSQWQGAGAPAEQCWRVEGGVLECTGEKGPWLRSAEQYGDFNFRCDYQVSDGGNSGVYVRVPEGGNHHRASEEQPPAGFEVQVLDDQAPKHRNLKPYQYTGSVYDIAPATSHVGRAPGQWNSLEIDCRGQHVVVVHNGTLIVDAKDAEFPLLKLRQTSGYLGLQNHSTLVRFRDVRIGPSLSVLR